ncbi:hypothetical protein AB0M80_11345 [Amycolatopsis sp. NPDC051045]|uniref:hypothetical protein n=1 Tax=Amycolatopsis sp. NPDC051045 TaxID=3156922 RepID=UPI0034210529
MTRQRATSARLAIRVISAITGATPDIARAVARAPETWISGHAGDAERLGAQRDAVDAGQVLGHGDPFR